MEGSSNGSSSLLYSPKGNADRRAQALEQKIAQLQAQNHSLRTSVGSKVVARKGQ